jgi:hypothetical protein
MASEQEGKMACSKFVGKNAVTDIEKVVEAY